VKPLRLVLIALGILVFLAGLTFTLQGYGAVGPGSSFMYQNKTWVYTGAVVLVAGLILAYAGVRLNERPAAAATSPQP